MALLPVLACSSGGEESLGLTAGPRFQTTILPDAEESLAYSFDLLVSGGTAPWNFNLTSGQIPPGMSLSGARLSGTPSVGGLFNFTITVSDSGVPVRSQVQSFSLLVALASSSGNPLNLWTSSLPAATENSAYSASLSTSGGTAPYIFEVSSGALPPGISLNAGTGAISGIPTQVGTYSFTARVQDSLGVQATSPLTLAVMSTDPSQPGLSLVANRTSGVAPLAVFFDASATITADPMAPHAFRDLAYSWDFGDAGSSRPTSSGPLAAHVFESPGTFNVQLTVIEPDGSLGTKTVTIVVDDPNVVFAGANTICFSSSGNFTGAPAGAQQITQTSFDNALGSYAVGRRLLFRRGDSFTSSGRGLNASGAGIIGAFGQGANPDQRGIFTNNPRVVCSGSGPLNIRGSDFRIMDLQFEDPSGATDHVFNADNRLLGSLLLRLKSTGFRVPFLISYDVTRNFGLDPHSENTIADCHIDQPRINGFYISGHQLAFLGNRVERCGISHLVRVTYTDRCVIDGNELFYPGGTRLALKLHAHQDKAKHGQYAQRIVVRNNHMKATTGWIVVVGPKDNASNEELRDVIIERNLITAEGDATQAIRLNCQDVTVRNNVFFDNGTTNYSFRCVFVGKYGPEPAPSGIEIYHNTYYGLATRSNAYVAEVLTHVGGPAIVKNNLAWNPATANVKTVVGSAQFSEVGNLDNVNPMFTNPGGMVFTLQLGSPALSAGLAAPVLDDYAGKQRRTTVKPPDVGAHERN